MAKNKLFNPEAADNENIIQKIMNAQAAAPEPAAETAAPATMSKASKTTSVYLTADQHAKLESIARELDTNKHAVLQLAVRRFIEDWNNGYRPEPVYKKVYR